MQGRVALPVLGPAGDALLLALADRHLDVVALLPQLVDTSLGSGHEPVVALEQLRLEVAGLGMEIPQVALEGPDLVGVLADLVGDSLVLRAARIDPLSALRVE